YPKQPVHWSFPDFLEKLTSMEAVVVLLTWRRWSVLKNITMIRPVFPTTCRNEIIRTVGLIGETDVQMPTKTGKKLCLRITSLTNNTTSQFGVVATRLHTSCLWDI